MTRKDGKWSIPSHYNYQADAKQRLVDTATGVIGLVKDSIRSDRAEDQEAFGVVDPLDTKASNSLKGIGKRITLKDASDKVLADFIIGKEVKDHPDQRYVRVPGQKRIYGVNVKVDLSTRFADWIETNLLKLDAARVRKVVIDQKEFDPTTGREVPGDVITLDRKDSSTPWTIEGMPEGKEPNTETLLALSNALGDLKIAGIRPKPEGLTADLKQAPGEVKPTTQACLAGRWQGVLPHQDRPALQQGRGDRQDRRGGGLHPPIRRGRHRHRRRTLRRVEPSKEAKDLGKATNKGTKARPRAATSSSPPPSTPA